MIHKIDAYLDRLFDCLSGSGASGRRLLQETEGHLHAALSAEMAAGLDENAAADRAIARFGTPEQVAGAHARQTRLPLPVALLRLVAAAWFFIGWTGAMFALAGLLFAGFSALFGHAFVAPDPDYATYSVDYCAQLSVLYPGIADCQSAASASYVAKTISSLFTLGAIGLAALAAFWLARRSQKLRFLTILPNPAMTASVGAVGFGLVGFSGLVIGIVMLANGAQPGTGANLALGLAGLASFLMFFPRAWLQLRSE